MRFDIYGLIHKAQRKYLFDLSSLIAKADPLDTKQIHEIEEKVAFIVRHLQEHAENEHTFIHPLLKAIDSADAVLDEQHDDLEQKLDHLLASSKARDLKKLYVALNNFIATYLEHLALEESLQESVLWQHYTDAQILEAMKKFLASKSQEALLKDSEFMVPTMNIHEIQHFFGPK